MENGKPLSLYDKMVKTLLRVVIQRMKNADFSIS